MKTLGSALQFVIGIAVAISLAFIIPGWGAQGGVLQSQYTAKLAVIFIFFLQGLSLPLEAIQAALGKVRLHVFVQCFSFLFFPLMIASAVLPLRGILPADLWLGFIYLAVLPTTISTCIVYTSTAGGDVAAAVFNVTLANLAGIFIVPLVMAWLVAESGNTLPVAPLLVNICGFILLPMLAGQGLRFFLPPMRAWLSRQKGRVKTINTYLVFYIIFCAFSNSVQDAIWQSVPVGLLVATGGLCLAFFLVALAVASTLLFLLRFEREDRLTGFFCSTQKGLAAAVPMAQSIFAGSNIEVSLILLPILIYHALTLSIEGVLAGAFSRHERP